MSELIDDVCELVARVLFEDTLITVVEDMFLGTEIRALVTTGVILTDDVTSVARVSFAVGVTCKSLTEAVDVPGLDGLD